MKLKLDLSEILSDGDICTYHFDDSKRNAQIKNLEVKKSSEVPVEMLTDGGFVIIAKSK